MKDIRKQITKEIFIPFGIEIEMEGTSFDEGKRVLQHKVNESWQIKTDRSLMDGGIELVSPVLSNEIGTFHQLRKIAKTLEFLQPTFEHASFQVNLDAYTFKKEDFVNLLKMFSVYEDIIYRFSMGEDEHLRKNAFEYIKPIRYLLYNEYLKISKTEINYEEIINNKFFALSLKTKTKEKKDPIKVVEFRTPNGTYNYDLWINYITFFSAFLTYIKSRSYDKEKIDYLFEQTNFSLTIEAIEAIDEENAIQLAESIFTNEEDKNAFYKQYIYKNKSYKSKNKSKENT